MQIPRRRSDARRAHDDGPIPLTRDGLANLKRRLERLKSDLPHLRSEAARTAAFGDRSDNAEYTEAKSQLRRANRQLLVLQDQINRAVIIAPGPSASGTVQLGSTVVLETDGGGHSTFQILGPRETDPGNGRISDRSPLGAALMNHAVGDTVTVQAGNGAREYRIIEVR